MKKVLNIVLITLVLFLCACNKNKLKTFTGGGLTITVDYKFIEKEEENTSLYLIKDDMVVIVYSHNSDEGYSIRDYAIELFGEESKIYRYKDEIITYDYCYYIKEIDNSSFGYMVCVFKENNNYYIVNFICDERNFEKNKPCFLEYAKTIRVI